MTGPHSREVAERLSSALAEAEFDIGRAIIADIGIKRADRASDGSVTLTIEALTVAAD